MYASLLDPLLPGAPGDDDVLEAALLGAVEGPALALAQLARVPAVGVEVGAEAGVLGLDGVLADVGDEEQDEGGGEEAEGGGEVEGVLGRGGRAAAGGLEVGEDPGADEGADLADGGGDAVVDATDPRGARLGGEEADVVAGAELAKGEEAEEEVGDLVFVFVYLCACASVCAFIKKRRYGLDQRPEGEARGEEEKKRGGGVPRHTFRIPLRKQPPCSAGRACRTRRP